MTCATIHAVLETYFAALHECDAAKFHLMFHPRGVLLGLGPTGAVVARTAEEFCAGVVARGSSTEYATHDRVLSLDVIDDTCACAKVQLALPPAPTSPTPTTEATLYTDWVTLLFDAAIDGGSWRIISKVYSSAPLGAAEQQHTPTDFLEAANVLWEGYRGAGRAGDALAMRRVFHPRCNLTFAKPDGVMLINCDDFCETNVGARWEMEMHRPYAHLKDDPRAAASDSLLALDFAGPGVCRAILRVGYPPFLYTDVLLLLKQDQQQQQQQRLESAGGWWIVAKSSGNVPFLKEEAHS